MYYVLFEESHLSFVGFVVCLLNYSSLSDYRLLSESRSIASGTLLSGGTIESQ